MNFGQEACNIHFCTVNISSLLFLSQYRTARKINDNVYTANSETMAAKMQKGDTKTFGKAFCKILQT